MAILFVGLGILIWGIYEWKKNKGMNLSVKVPMLIAFIGIMVMITGFGDAGILMAITVVAGTILFYSLAGVFISIFRRDKKLKLNLILLGTSFIIGMTSSTINANQLEKAAEEKAKLEAEEAKLAAEQKAKEEAEAKLAAEQKAKEEEARLAAEQKAKEEEAARLAAEQKAKEEEAARVAAEQKAKEEEAARVAAEQKAKEEEAARVAEQQTQQTASSSKETFANCTDLRGTYPNGVPSTHPAYQSKMDRDHDNYACER